MPVCSFTRFSPRYEITLLKLLYLLSFIVFAFSVIIQSRVSCDSIYMQRPYFIQCTYIWEYGGFCFSRGDSKLRIRGVKCCVLKCNVDTTFATVCEKKVIKENKSTPPIANIVHETRITKKIRICQRDGRGEVAFGF
jgi:hypothetical protein